MRMLVCDAGDGVVVVMRTCAEGEEGNECYGVSAEAPVESAGRSVDVGHDCRVGRSRSVCYGCRIGCFMAVVRW